MKRACLMLIIAFPVLTAAPARAADAFQFADGDRAVWIGGTVIEREQKYGYWETALTLRHPDKNITFRNLGWSGDTVWGESRASFDFGKPNEGFRRLVEHTLALKPTVIFVGYGTNESFAGAAGLPRFREGLNALLDALAPAKARIVLLAPPRFEKETWRSGDLVQSERDLERYTDAIRQVAQQRQIRFADEFCPRYGPASPLMDNGMHLSSYGYRWTSHGLLNELKLAEGHRLQTIELKGLTPARITQPFLPKPPLPVEPGASEFQGDCFVRAKSLPPGKYTLLIDGRPVHTSDAQTWMHDSAFGVLVPQGPSLDQAEKLRQAIVEKNQLYFHRWRPQNETYLFGFRKHEQGQNAREVPQFDPMIAKLEAEIARLRVPVAHEYALIPQPERKK